MVKGIDGNDNIIRLKGQKQNLDTSKLEGLKQTEKNKAIFDKFDENRDGTLDAGEANNMQNWLKETAGNTKLSGREMKKATKDKSAFDALSSLAQQQRDLAEKNEYLEENQNLITHVVKNNDVITKFDSKEDESGNTIETYDDGTKQIRYKDGSHDEIDKDGATTKFDKDGNKTTYVKDGLTTTFTPDGNKSVTKNEAGELVEEIELQDGKEIKTTYEKGDGTVTKRQFTNGVLDFLTVSGNTEDGHTVDTTYKTEEDKNNGKPMQVVYDAQNPALKTVKNYTPLDNGNVKIETISPDGVITTTFENEKGEKIDNPEQQTTYTVQKGDSITKIVKDALKAQGIENPTSKQLRKAKAEFLEMNKDLVKIYNGVRQEWKGNKFFYPDDVVKIPKFNKEEKPVEVQEQVSADNLTESAREALLRRIRDLDNDQKVEAIKNVIGDDYTIEIDSDGKIVVKEKNGNVLENITRIINDEKSDNEDIDTMLESDKDGNKTLELSEFQSFIEQQLEEINFEITDANRVKITEIIGKHFNNIDTVQKDGSLTREELNLNAEKVIKELTDELGEAE